VVTQKTSHSYVSGPPPAVHSAAAGSVPGAPAHGDLAEA
jgi:hypothetical protein